MATAKRPQVAFPAANSDYRAARLRSAVACRAYNDLPEDAPSEQRVALWHKYAIPSHLISLSNIPNNISPSIIGSPSSSSPSTPPAPPPTPAAPYIKPPLHIDYGTNLHIAPTTFINRNLTVLDTPELPVRIGERCLLGPNVSIYAVAHPVGWRERNGPLGAPSYASEVVIEDDCWIGGGVTVVGGVRIGRGAVVGAGSVVTKVSGLLSSLLWALVTALTRLLCAGCSGRARCSWSPGARRRERVRGLTRAEPRLAQGAQRSRGRGRSW